MLPKLLKIFSNRYKTLNVCHLRAVKYLATKQMQAIGNKNPKNQLKNECLGSIKILFDAILSKTPCQLQNGIAHRF